MTIAFTAIGVRSERRLRLVFSEAVGAAAFTTLGYYSIVCSDGTGADPAPVAAFVVPSNPAVVELALDLDLAPGAPYTVSAVGVPAAGGGGGVTPGGSQLPFRQGEKRQPKAARVASDVLLAELYGEDLVWDGQDVSEAQNGDLETVSGKENVSAALERRLMSDGLPWDQQYGAKPRKFVDGSPLLVGDLRGDLISQALEDDRVTRASSVVLPLSEPEYVWIETTVYLLGGEIAVVKTGVQSA